ncbi:hypothetical protein SAY87_024094 [Trapa incisa]|uniref:Uncharacterized protein n=1 Tax=Trapa incisa TaxID=236973 RepID=A0AAN7QUW5_9MYRT|nr:hypothetical protein SAY87_024094 [Trapa incisa]
MAKESFIDGYQEGVQKVMAKERKKTFHVIHQATSFFPVSYSYRYAHSYPAMNFPFTQQGIGEHAFHNRASSQLKQVNNVCI